MATFKISFVVVLVCCASTALQAADLYVSTTGSDTNPGTVQAPLASIDGARQAIAAQGLAGQEPVTVHVADGVYYLPETVVFTAKDSGKKEGSVVYRAQNEGRAILSGGSKLKLSWTPWRDGIYQAKTPAGLKIDQVFVNGQNQRMARYPNYDPAKKASPYQGFAADAFATERAKTWQDPTGGYIHAMHRAGWGGYHYRITGKDSTGAVTYEGGWQNNRRMGMHKDHRMVENIFEELDAPGEWYHNAETSTLYYLPAPNVDLANAQVEVVRLAHLIEFNGSQQAPVQFIRLEGFTIRHAARTFMDCKEPLLRSDWAIYRGGAIVLNGTQEISILDCEFDQVGGNAIFVNHYNRGVLVQGCHIHDTGASGVCFVGDPNAVRDPLFEYGQKNDLATIDRTPGPKTNNYPAESAVADCLIHGVGRVERQPAGVLIEMAAKITVSDCSIYDTARAGINIGDGAWGGHVIQRCDVFDTVLETHDHGSFNSWGRDRYWRSDHLTASQQAVDADPKLPFLDAIHTTVIRDSRWRCEHGWDIDLDDGSSNYDIYNNLMLCGGLKLREGFRRQAWNNVIVDNGLSSHVWFQNSHDQVTGNIMARAYTPLIRNNVTVDGLVDKNFYYQSDQAQLDKNATKYGWDGESLSGDPMFVDPENGDFSVQDASPALKIGFKNFPMDQFGVKKPSLKALALTPSFLPKSGRRAKPVAAPMPLVKVWLGAVVQDLTGNQFSAFGVSKDEAGVVMSQIPDHSVAARSGLKPGDLIQGLADQRITNTQQLFIALTRLQAETIKLTLVRNQQTLELSVKPAVTVHLETANASADFKTLLPQATIGGKVSTNIGTSNDPVQVLTDRKLSKGYGPVFGNATSNGAYKLDLGEVKPIAAVNSWSYRMGPARVSQKFTLYASRAETDPGWDLKKYTPLATIVTGTLPDTYAATSVRAADGGSLGKFRWIIWRTSPVSAQGGGENTSFQELGVQTH